MIRIYADGKGLIAKIEDKYNIGLMVVFEDKSYLLVNNNKRVILFDPTTSRVEPNFGFTTLNKGE